MVYFQAMNLSHTFQVYRPAPRENSLYIGRFVLLENPDFCTDFLSWVAEKERSFPSFERWLSFLKKTYKSPDKPNKDNPFLYKQVQYRYSQSTKAQAYRAYIFAKKIQKYEQEIQKVHQKKEKQAYISNRYTADKQGYCQYVFDRMPDKDKLFLKSSLPFYISEKERLRHTYISGSTGSGKSELIKILIHNYMIQNKETALILIDPHGKIAREVAQFKENGAGERLIVVNTGLQHGKHIVFNPLDVEQNNISAYHTDVLSQELIGAFKEILQDAGFTPQMETLLKPCLATLLQLPKAHLYHLQQFMNEEENEELLQYAKRHLKNAAQKHFLETEFSKTSYAPSRQSITTKLQSLLNSQIFSDFVIGESTFSLAQAIKEKKIILFNLSRQAGIETSDTIGRLVLSTLQALAMQRQSNKEPAIHLFIDECQHYITPSIETILTEARKYKLHLTLANQFNSQIRDRLIRYAIQGNTNIKITGKQTEADTLAELQRSIGVDADVIRHLNLGEYYIKVGTHAGLKVQTGAKLIDDKYAMNKDKWDTLMKKQLEQYYRLPNTETLFARPSYQVQRPTRKKGLN